MVPLLFRLPLTHPVSPVVFLRKTWNAALYISLSASKLKVIDEELPHSHFREVSAANVFVALLLIYIDAHVLNDVGGVYPWSVSPVLSAFF